MPSNSSAIPKLRQMDLAWPICRYPFGSGGKRVSTRPPCLPVVTSSETISSKKLGPFSVDIMILFISYFNLFNPEISDNQLINKFQSRFQSPYHFFFSQQFSHWKQFHSARLTTYYYSKQLQNLSGF